LFIEADPFSYTVLGSFLSNPVVAVFFNQFDFLFRVFYGAYLKLRDYGCS
jgi:hypothetical protein